jgi:hypothetical protein
MARLVPDDIPMHRLVPDVPILVPDDQPSPTTPSSRGFFEKIGESYERGDYNFNTGVSIYQALKQKQDMTPVLQAHWNTQRTNQEDPVDGNFMADLAYGGANVGQLLATAEKAVPVAIAGAGAGAALGATVGAAMPTIGEEPFTIGGGAVGGFGVGLKAGYMGYSYQSIAGNMYADLVKDGNSSDLAESIAGWAAIPSMVVEFYQGKQTLPKGVRELMTKTAEKSTAKFFKKYLTRYGKTLSKEVLEEVAQEGIQIVAEDTARVLRKEGVTVDEEFLKERVGRLWETGKQAAKMMALVPLPGTIVEAGIEAGKEHPGGRGGYGPADRERY